MKKSLRISVKTMTHKWPIFAIGFYGGEFFLYLWLVDAGSETKTNFMLMAKKAGIAPARVIFGERADFDAHIQVSGGLLFDAAGVSV